MTAQGMSVSTEVLEKTFGALDGFHMDGQESDYIADYGQIAAQKTFDIRKKRSNLDWLIDFS